MPLKHYLKAYLEPEQVERLIAVANPRDALLVRIPWRSGIRVSELIGIRVPDIDFGQGLFGVAKALSLQGRPTFPYYQAEGWPDLLEAGKESRDKGDRRPGCFQA